MKRFTLFLTFYYQSFPRGTTIISQLELVLAEQIAMDCEKT